MKKILLILISFMFLACSNMEKTYQNDMDKRRVRDVEYISKIIYEYYQILGKYPLQDKVKNKNITVFLTNKKIEKAFIDQNNEQGFELHSLEEFEKEIEKVLGRELDLPEDPQKVPTYAANFYIYFVNKESASVMGNLYSKNDFTVDAGNYYKYEKVLKSSPMNLEFSEIFIDYNVRGKYIYLKQYNIKARKSDDIFEKVKEIEKKISTGEFIKDEYSLSTMRTRQERIFEENGIVIGEYNLTVEEKNVSLVLKEILGEILKQNIDVIYDEARKEMYIIFEERDIHITENEFKAVYGEDNGSQRIIVWDVEKENFSGVFTQKKENEKFESIKDYMENEMTSPELD